MSGAETVEGPVTAEQVTGWEYAWIPDPLHPAFEVACKRRDRRRAGIGDAVEARLRLELGPRRIVLVQHRIWVVHDPAERQRMRWGEEQFTSLDDLRTWLEQAGLPVALAEAIASRVEKLPTPVSRTS